MQATDLAGQLAACDAGGPAAANAQRLAELEAALAAAQARVGELEAAAAPAAPAPALGPRPRRNENKENAGAANGPPAAPAQAAARKPHANALGSRYDTGEGKVRAVVSPCVHIFVCEATKGKASFTVSLQRPVTSLHPVVHACGLTQSVNRRRAAELGKVSRPVAQFRAIVGGAGRLGGRQRGPRRVQRLWHESVRAWMGGAGRLGGRQRGPRRVQGLCMSQ